MYPNGNEGDFLSYDNIYAPSRGYDLAEPRKRLEFHFLWPPPKSGSVDECALCGWREQPDGLD